MLTKRAIDAHRLHGVAEADVDDLLDSHEELRDTVQRIAKLATRDESPEALIELVQDLARAQLSSL